MINRAMSFGCILLLSVFTAQVQAKVTVGEDLHLQGSGSKLVFPDGSVQYSATVDGPQGVSGVNGFTSLIDMIDEPVGTNCVFGGTKVMSGIDSNRNGVLETGEVKQTKYVCNNGGIIVSGGNIVGTTARMSVLILFGPRTLRTW